MTIKLVEVGQSADFMTIKLRVLLFGKIERRKWIKGSGFGKTQVKGRKKSKLVGVGAERWFKFN